MDGPAEDGGAELGGAEDGGAEVGEPEPEPDGDSDGDSDGEVGGQCECGAEGEAEGDWDGDGECEGECACEGDAECEAVRDGEVHGDAPDAEGEPLGAALQEVLGSAPGRHAPGGGGTRWSPPPCPPVGRSNQIRSCWSYSTTTFTWVTDSLTTTTFPGRNDPHAVPVNVCAVFVAAAAGRSGLPQAQRALGSPRASISTAVPASRTAENGVALP